MIRKEKWKSWLSDKLYRFPLRSLKFWENRFLALLIVWAQKLTQTYMKRHYFLQIFKPIERKNGCTTHGHRPLGPAARKRKWLQFYLKCFLRRRKTLEIRWKTLFLIAALSPQVNDFYKLFSSTSIIFNQSINQRPVPLIYGSSRKTPSRLFHNSLDLLHLQMLH